MEDKIIRKLFLGFINIHILHHAQNDPFYGSWMIEELGKHGYRISAGTLYPVLHSLEKNGLIVPDVRNVDGKIRKYYSITPLGEEALAEGRAKAYELFKEIRG
ncbi:PadR family transcriptional regulator [Candidatus Bathyarchaeota archaeon RBG_13_52_12]|nr:MAG: PadR family transcriptional regulator [Candidatus Bathyarchaeota archaeon RBG_16_57_9]OGD56746.1 MAG: PadR family transcriptional regulator [Candidatus Bathyarchaeota archaeon RBG_13_52_12]